MDLDMDTSKVHIDRYRTQPLHCAAGRWTGQIQ